MPTSLQKSPAKTAHARPVDTAQEAEKPTLNNGPNNRKKDLSSGRVSQKGEKSSLGFVTDMSG